MPEILNGRTKSSILRLIHEKNVPLLENGLVDIDGLNLYLHPNPHYVPLHAAPGWKYHHVNHPESSFKQWGTDISERDHRLVALRNSSYQQLHMRISSEAIYHNVHEVYVPHPTSESVDKALRDFERLDLLGAACLYLNLLKGTSEYKFDEGSANPRWMQPISLRDRVNFFTEVREEYASALIRAEILPERLVTSAIKRLSMHLRDPYLGKLADQRLESDPVFYPVRTPSHKTLLSKANRLISLDFLANGRQHNDALQTEVDRVELAA